MGYAKRRICKNGKVRYTAVYKDPRGKEGSAGTFPNRKVADDAWKDTESKARKGYLGDPNPGRKKFSEYVLEMWLPHHVVELTTREKYS